MSAVFAATARADSVFTVAPVKVETSAQHGASREATIFVTNQGGSAIAIDLSLADFKVGGDGSTTFMAAGHSKRSCAKWVHLPGRHFSLAPGSTRKVVIRVLVPQEARDGAYQAAVLVGTTGAPTGRGTLAVRGAIATKLLLTVGNVPAVSPGAAAPLHTVTDTTGDSGQGQSQLISALLLIMTAAISGAGLLMLGPSEGVDRTR